MGQHQPSRTQGLGGLGDTDSDATVRGPTPLMGHLSFLIEAMALRHIDSLTHFIIKPGHLKLTVSQRLGGTGWHWVSRGQWAFGNVKLRSWLEARSRAPSD